SLDGLIGEGASGVIHRAGWHQPDGSTRTVALKLFKGEVTSDGTPASEMAAASLAALMAHLHGRGISHGDFYAHNILWREDGACLLGDFGAASFLPDDAV
ncbi:protein kinase, partial [Escherichia coli]|uniref:lipopolysaccharide kinase InaA family protein n=1 Tax=Escherichia coli TaxID=562 RepID=UPI000FEEC4FA